MRSPTPCLSVVMPIYNEVVTLRSILQRVLESPWVQEIIAIDDGSTDGTRDILKAHEAGTALLVAPEQKHKLKIFYQPINQGKGAAVREGVQKANAEFLIIQDADLEYDPSEYGRLLEPLLLGDADVVFGSRFLGERRRVLYFWHTLGNKFLTLLSNVCTNLNLTDMETCYKAFKTAVIKSIPIRSNRFGIEPELTAKVAKLRCVIYEVPITYKGRGYAEGKKINWKDGVAALLTILKYWLIDDLYEASTGLRTLRIMEGAGRYNTWLFSHCRPYLGKRILEVGAGVGNITKFLLDREKVIATDFEEPYILELKRQFSPFPHVIVEKLDLLDDHGTDSLVAHHQIDTVICMNVLEHIEHDATALTHLADLLPSQGRLVMVVPAHQALHCQLDVNLGHYRRYGLAELTKKLETAGFRIVSARYLNWLGALGWFVNGKILRRNLIPSRQLRLFDWVVGLLSLEKIIRFSFGLSVIAIAEKK